jgi:hypothetical protein
MRTRTIRAKIKTKVAGSFVGFLQPLVRQQLLKTWSDKEIRIGDRWHGRIGFTRKTQGLSFY